MPYLFVLLTLVLQALPQMGVFLERFPILLSVKFVSLQVILLLLVPLASPSLLLLP